MSEDPDILIVGGGVIGLTCAYYLAREGARVTVVDQGDLGQEASWAGAGILPPGNPAVAKSSIAKLRARSALLHGELAQDLLERTGIDTGYVRCGGIELVACAALDCEEEWRSEGITCEALESKDLHRLEPALAPELASGYFIPDMAQVRNPRHLKALIAACADLRVCLRPGCAVQDLVLRGENVQALRTAQGELQAGRYLVAAGAWTAALLWPTGWRPGIRPVRGQIAMLNLGTPLLRRILLEGPRYIVPRQDGRVLVGSTEEDAGFDRATTAVAIADLLHLAVRLAPGLAQAEVERCWAGLRPGSADGLPYLGRVPGWDNLFVAAGHFRSGILLSPITGVLMKELLLGQELTLPLEAFRLEQSS